MTDPTKKLELMEAALVGDPDVQINAISAMRKVLKDDTAEELNNKQLRSFSKMSLRDIHEMGFSVNDSEAIWSAVQSEWTVRVKGVEGEAQRPHPVAANFPNSVAVVTQGDLRSESLLEELGNLTSGKNLREAKPTEQDMTVVVRGIIDDLGGDLQALDDKAAQIDVVLDMMGDMVSGGKTATGQKVEDDDMVALKALRKKSDRAQRKLVGKFF